MEWKKNLKLFTPKEPKHMKSKPPHWCLSSAFENH